METIIVPAVMGRVLYFILLGIIGDPATTIGGVSAGLIMLFVILKASMNQYSNGNDVVKEPTKPADMTSWNEYTLKEPRYIDPRYDSEIRDARPQQVEHCNECGGTLAHNSRYGPQCTCIQIGEVWIREPSGSWSGEKLD